MPTGFRCLTDEQLGELQFRYVDLGEPAAALAQRFGISQATVYRAISAVPSECASVDELAVRRWRKRHGNLPKQRRRKRA